MDKSPLVVPNVSKLSDQSHHHLREKLQVEVEVVSIEDVAEEGKTAALMFVFQLLSSNNNHLYTSNITIYWQSNGYFFR